MDEIEREARAMLSIALEAEAAKGYVGRCGDELPHVPQVIAEEVIAAALRSARVPEWRPIETAPRDELVLVYDYRKNQFSIGSVYKFTYATHWMPLPAVPSAYGYTSD